MKLQVGVKIAIRNKRNEVLLIKRNTDKYKDINGEWDIPGGRIDPGISLFENLQRELEEELAIDWVGSTKLIAAQDILLPNKHVVRLTYSGKSRKKLDIKLDHSENIEYKWFTKGGLKKLGNKLDKYFKEVLFNHTTFS